MEAVVLFDLDGTLIDSTEAILEGFAHAYGQFGVVYPGHSSIEELIGYPLDIIFSRLGVEDAMVESFIVAYKAKYREIANEKTFLLDGAKEAVELASSFARLGVVTTKTSRYSIDLLEHLGIMQHFVTVVGKEDVQNPKPHPEPIFLAIDRMGVKDKKLNDIWMIGDTMMDIEAARSAGVAHVAVMTGYGDKNVLKMRSDCHAKDALEAIEVLKKRYEGR